MREYITARWGQLVLVLALLASGCTLIGESIPTTPTPDRPTVTFLYPPNNAQVFEGTDLTIELLAQDDTAGIERVELFLDDISDEPLRTARPVDNATVPVFRVEMNWLASGIGRHQLTARTYRLDGTPSDEETILIEVISRADSDTNTPQATPSPGV